MNNVEMLQKISTSADFSSFNARALGTSNFPPFDATRRSRVPNRVQDSPAYSSIISL
ncbi:hypothetical protein ACS0TY_027166 [Phlomoides rotata]